MKGLILAILWFMIFLAVATTLLRSRRWRKPFKLFLGVFAATLPPYILCYRVTPPDLNFLPRNCLEPCTAVDLIYGLLVYTLLFHNFWDFVYAGPMGFSSGLMVDLLQSGEKGSSAEQLTAYFKAGEETDKVLGRRIPNLLRGGYISMKGDEILLSRKGRFLANLTLFLKRLVSAGEGG